MSLKKQLERYKKHLQHGSESETSPKLNEEDAVKEPSKVTDMASGPVNVLSEALQQAAADLDAEVKLFDGQAMLEKRSVYSLSAKHGIYCFADLYEAVSLWQNHLQQHPLSSNGLEAEELLFFDTETTGLGSGAGHMIFLLGAGKIIEDRFEVTQYFLPGPGHETAFYYYFLKDNQSLANLVTFNGKAFDWPRVKTRVQFVKERVPKLPEFGHFDLLHASRRFWKEQYESVRLSTVEENRLGVKRELDVPGHMAPFLYFQFLKAPKASLVNGVFDHNKEDILTLVTLYIHLTRLLHQEAPATALEQFQACRWLFQLGAHTEASLWLERLLEQAHVEPVVRGRAMELLGYVYKKSQQLDKAKNMFETLIDQDLTDNHNVLIELAKYYEHQEKDYEKAHFFTKKAQLVVEQSPLLRGNARLQEASALLNRLSRLDKKAYYSGE